MPDEGNENEDITTNESENVDSDDSDGDEELDVARAKAKIAKANREAKNLRTRLKELEDAEAARKESEMSDLEKANARAEAAEKRAQELEFNSVRAEIAAEKGLTPAQAKRLQGSTKEELEADADDLLEAFKAAGGTPKPRTGKLRGGSNPDESATELDPDKLAAQIRPR
jgi:hypothetical protein